MLQELEWHFHAALFALVLGYGYIHNSHVRVDLIRENLAFRKKAWLEFLGITLFLIPYLRASSSTSPGATPMTSYDDERDLGLDRRPDAPLDHQERCWCSA